MNTNTIFGMGIALGASGLLMAGCQKQEAATPQSNVQTQVVQEAVTTREQVTAQPQGTTQAANDIVEKIKTLLAQAKQYLDEGKFNEAISTAQNVLSLDPTNLDAQKIIETAKTKIQEMGAQKAGDLKKGVMDKVSGFGK